MSLRAAAVLAFGALMLPGPGVSAEGRYIAAYSRFDGPHALADTQAGSVRMVTYNVAGLPWLVAGSRPGRSMARIGRLLNAFDVALVQEDFAWHDELTKSLRHPFRSRPGGRGTALTHDGLSTFSSLPLGNVRRVAWTDCHGHFNANSDCFARKGFSVGEIALAGGVRVHVYNLHADAGKQRGDKRGRAAQYTQLARFLRHHSFGRAVLVGGDTNLASLDDDEETLRLFLGRTDLVDSCRQIGCGDDRIDRVLYRSSERLALEPTEWRIDPRFIDTSGAPLSDHAAIAVTMAWRVTQETVASAP